MPRPPHPPTIYQPPNHRTHAHTGAILWGFALCIAIYVTASISTAHLNPAVSVAMSVIRSKEFSLQYCAAYILSQLTGSFCAALVNFWIFLPHLRKYEGA